MKSLIRASMGVVIAFSMTTPFAFSPARATAYAAVAAAPPAATGKSEPLRFAGVPWGTSAARVTQRYAHEGWRLRVPREGGGTRLVGRVWGRSADIEPEYDGKGALAAVTLRFHPESESDALALYNQLVARLRARHGPWDTQIDPARPIATEWVGRDRRLLSRQPLTAATLWVSPVEDAAAVQLDADHYVWVRYESREWGVAHAESAEQP